jgi:phosphoadenosine phosphosulfate reductase
MAVALWSPPASAGARSSLPLAELQRRLSALKPDRAVLAFSLQLEDAVILHVAREMGLNLTPLVLDTGRLHAESLAYLEAIESRYGVTALRMQPDPQAVQGFVTGFGQDGFYDSLEARKACCRIRKVEPLGRGLARFEAWVTGQRRHQAQSRTDLAFTEQDAERGITKHNPLADWTTRDVWEAARHLGVSANPLYARGFASIGCEPCTRPIRANEDERAGRWWWEQTDTKECGLHSTEGRAP